MLQQLGEDLQRGTGWHEKLEWNHLAGLAVQASPTHSQRPAAQFPQHCLINNRQNL